MRKQLSFFVISIFLFTSLSAGVIKESKSSVSFKSFGKFITQTKTKIQGDFQREDSKQDFEGHGFMGKMMAKAFVKAGNSGSIIDLQNMKQIQLDHSNKEFTVMPLEKMDWDKYQGEPQEENVREEPEEESKIRIIKQDFKVTRSGKKKTINGFKCEKYTVKWETVWENTETGEQGTDKLNTVVWTTEAGKTIKNAQKEEMAFHTKQMKKMGLDEAFGQDDILGTRWMGMFGSMNKGQGSKADFSDSKYAKEMQKIEGYPIVIDGKYYAIRPEKEGGKEKKKNVDMTDIQSVFGGLMGKAMRKNKKKSEKSGAAFSFHTEIINIKTGDIPASEFQPPQGYTKVEH